MYKEPPGCPSVPHTEPRRLGGVHQRRGPHPHPGLPAQRQHLLGLVLPVFPGLPTWGRSGRGGSVTGAQAHTHPPAASITDGQATLHRFLPLLGLVCAPGPLGPGGGEGSRVMTPNPTPCWPLASPQTWSPKCGCVPRPPAPSPGPFSGLGAATAWISGGQGPLASWRHGFPVGLVHRWGLLNQGAQKPGLQGAQGQAAMKALGWVVLPACPLLSVCGLP